MGETQQKENKNEKKILFTTALVLVTAVLIFGAVNRSLAKNGNENTYVGGYGQSHVIPNENTFSVGYGQRQSLPSEPASPALVSPGELSTQEIEALLYMREEEKLAHDVYTALYARWGLPIFQNISRSELTHTNAIQSLIDRYGLTDPATNESGVFTNPDLQALYDELVRRGGQSLAEALKTGAAIEEIDILDLEKELEQVEHTDIQQVFENLLRGSRNHLRAFVSTLKAQTGETYQPQYLAADDFQSSLSSQAGIGNTGRGGTSRGQAGGRWGRP